MRSEVNKGNNDVWLFFASLTPESDVIAKLGNTQRVETYIFYNINFINFIIYVRLKDFFLFNQ